MSDEQPNGVRTTMTRVDPDTVAQLATQRTRFRMQRDEARAEVNRTKAENARLTAEHADLTVRADTSASARKVQELEGKLREIDHRKVFDRVAKSKGVAEDTLDLLYQTSGYKAEQPQPDEIAIGVMLDETRVKPGFSRLFGEAAPPNGQTTTPPPKPGPGSGQGGPNQGRVPMAPDDPRHGDVRYVFENFDQISADARARIERGEV